MLSRFVLLECTGVVLSARLPLPSSALEQSLRYKGRVRGQWKCAMNVTVNDEERGPS